MYRVTRYLYIIKQANASNNDRWGVRAVGALPWFQHPILFRKKVQTHRISEYDLIPISCFCGLLQKSFVDWVKIHLSMMISMMFEEFYYEIRCKCNDFRSKIGGWSLEFSRSVVFEGTVWISCWSLSEMLICTTLIGSMHNYRCYIREFKWL